MYSHGSCASASCLPDNLSFYVVGTSYMYMYMYDQFTVHSLGFTDMFKFMCFPHTVQSESV